MQILQCHRDDQPTYYYIHVKMSIKVLLREAKIDIGMCTSAGGGGVI